MPGRDREYECGLGVFGDVIERAVCGEMESPGRVTWGEDAGMGYGGRELGIVVRGLDVDV